MTEKDPEVQAKIDQLVADIIAQNLPKAEAWRKYQSAPHALELDELHSLALSGLAHAANRWQEYCVVPQTRVLTAGLEWVPAGEVVVGEELVGFDEYPTPRDSGVSRDPRRYRRSVIKSADRHVLPCVRVELEDGREVVCSTDHQWLTYRRHGDYRQRRLGLPVSKTSWWASSELRVGDQILSPFRPWGRETSFDMGWLSGVYDGEGSLGRNCVSVAQNPGRVLAHIKFLLKGMGLEFTSREASGSRVEVVQLSSRRDTLELLGRLQPLRLMPKSASLWDGKSMWNRRERCAAPVKSIEYVGDQEVVALETSSSTFLAEGLASHNCAKEGHDPHATQFFGAYAMQRMRGAMLDAMRSNDWATRSTRSRFKQLREAGQDQGKTDHELADATGMSVTEVRDTVAAVARKPVSMDAEPHDVADTVDVEGQVVVSGILQAVEKVTRTLPAAVQVILALRFYHGLSLPDAAKAVGVREDEVQRLHNEALLRIHDEMIKAVS